jgi:hypothetical protein
MKGVLLSSREGKGGRRTGFVVFKSFYLYSLGEQKLAGENPAGANRREYKKTRREEYV